MDNSKNTKELFRILNNLTGCNTHNPLPPGKSSEETAEEFAEFFFNKITKIWQSFRGTLWYHPEETNTPKFTSFRPLTDDEVKREIMSMKNKTCELDQISTLMLKEVITACLPTITYIVNMSLTRGDHHRLETGHGKTPLINLAPNLYTRTTDLTQTYPSSSS